MITFSRNGTKVQVYIEIGMNTAKEVIATIECNNELYAELLRNEIMNKLDKRIEMIREIEYLRGRRREKKQTWFKWMFDNDEYERVK